MGELNKLLNNIYYFIKKCIITPSFLLYRKHTKKIPMNALEKTSPKKEVLTPNNALLDLDFFTTKPSGLPKTSTIVHSPNSVTPNDDVMVDISTDDNNPSMRNNILNTKLDSPLDNILDLGLPLQNDKEKKLESQDVHLQSDYKDKVKAMEVKPLTDINLTIQSVQPSKVPSLKAFEGEDGLSVVLHFCKDKPRPDVSVIVISTTSKSSFPIEDYKFQAVVPKVSLYLILIKQNLYFFFLYFT